MNFLTCIISTITGLMIGAVLGFFLLLALNGFAGRAADYAVYFYVAWVVVLSLIVGAIGFFGTNFLIRRSFNNVLSVMIPVIIAVVLSVGGNFLGMIISAVAAEELWKK